MLLDDWQSRGVAFVTLGEGIDTNTPAGRLVAGVLGSIAEFERARIRNASWRAWRGSGRKERGSDGAPGDAARRLDECEGLSHAQAAAHLNVSVATVKRWRRSSRVGSETSSAVT
jgi:DNA invertase Pin-like site-specific DNA recombinase